MTNWSTVLLFILLLSCADLGQQHRVVQDQHTNFSVAFGSCNDVNRKQHLWDEVLAGQPNAWVWLGDNVYADTKDMSILGKMYAKQKTVPGYKKLMESSAILGTWDDHDYGMNDGGKEFPMKRESQKEFLDFLDLPEDAPQRQRDGVYSDQLLDEGRIHLILLDCRFFRDGLEPHANRNDDRYKQNTTGTILGDDQWTWLTQTLQNSKAEMILLGSGIQVIPNQHPFEKWDNFPNQRSKLLSLLASLNKPIIILSGDRHRGEITQWPESPNLYEVTSSSLTHTYPSKTGEPNDNRIGKLAERNHFGRISVNDSLDQRHIQIELIGEGLEILARHTFSIP